jgi:AraC family L-rhamnose operon regulatory protein RhaS
LNSIGFWDADSSQNWDEDLHRNEGVEIAFLETGSLAYFTANKQQELRAGQFVVTRPWQLHKLSNIGPCRLHWLILDVGVLRPHQTWHWPAWMVLTRDDLGELTRRLCGNDDPVRNANQAMMQAFGELARTIAAWDQPHAVSRLATNLNQLFLGILGASSGAPGSEIHEPTSRQRAVESFLLQLKNDPITCQEIWTIYRMAEHCGMGVTAFSKYCREFVNAGPVEFLNRCRLDHAVHLLRHNATLSITDIAMTCGFNSSQYFATRFRQRFHVSPSNFIRRPGLLNLDLGKLERS